MIWLIAVPAGLYTSVLSVLYYCGESFSLKIAALQAFNASQLAIFLEIRLNMCLNLDRNLFLFFLIIVQP